MSTTTRGRDGSPRRGPSVRNRPAGSPRPARPTRAVPRQHVPGTTPGTKRPRKRSAPPHKRAVVLLGLMVGLFALLSLRLVMVQVVRADFWASYGEDQRIKPIHLVAGRGGIFDRNGYDLAISVPRKTFVADPRLVTKPAATAHELAPILKLDTAHEAALRKRLTRNASFVYVARQVPDDVAKRIEKAKLTGVWSIEESTRVNPAGDLARSLLGRVDPDNNGISALEREYNKKLSGKPGELIVERDLEGRTIPAGRHHLDPAEPGDDLELTIDRNLQITAERVMADAVRTREAKGGIAIVSNPETGEILALVNIARDAQGNPVNSGNNTALTAGYEPGSVNKVVTMAAAIEEGLVQPDTQLNVPSSMQVADHVFTDDERHPTQDMSVTDILTKSSNVGTIKIAQALGKQRLYDYLRDFGFGRRTALGFPQEANGSLLEPADWSGTSIGTIPIGHGVAVTAMQMLYAYNAIANDGVYVPPKVVDTIIDADGQKHDAPVSEKPHRVISAATAAKMRGMLANVVRSGTGRAADIAGYDVAGKTGTARKPQAGGSYRGPDGRVHHVATFAGFMPADDPKLSIIVVLDEPRQVYAATTAAPAFAELGRNALRLEHVPPPAPVTGGPTVSVEPPRVRAQAALPPATTTTTTTTSPTHAPTRRAAQNPTMDPAALAPSTTRPSALRLQLLPRRSG